MTDLRQEVTLLKQEVDQLSKLADAILAGRVASTMGWDITESKQGYWASLDSAPLSGPAKTRLEAAQMACKGKL